VAQPASVEELTVARVAVAFWVVTTPAPVPSAGWYPDPAGSGRLRYFNGNNWTDDYGDRPAPAADIGTTPGAGASAGIRPAPAVRGPRTRWILIGAALCAVLVLGGLGVGLLLDHWHRQSVLPFTGLNDVHFVAADTAGNVYVIDDNDTATNPRVLKLAAGASTRTVLPFSDLHFANAVAADTAGNVYVADSGNNRVLKLAAGASTQTVLPFSDLNFPVGVAADTAGNVYAADSGNNRVLKLAAGASTQTVLPFSDLNYPTVVAVDAAGDVFVTAGTDARRVLKLAAGASTQTVLPFGDPDLDFDGMAVDTAGNVYVSKYRDGFTNGGDHWVCEAFPVGGKCAGMGVNQVLKLAAGASTQTVLPFTGLNHPTDVAVDSAGNVYVIVWNDRRTRGYADRSGNKQVVKLATG
jgi:serine/threonine-protein kinase